MNLIKHLLRQKAFSERTFGPGPRTKMVIDHIRKELIEIENKIIKISLREKNRAVDEISFPDERNLMEKLLPAIDKILTRNDLAPSNIKKAQLKSDLSDNFTSPRIARTVVNVWKWVNKG